MIDTKQYVRSYRLYKPKKDGGGAASQFQLSKKERNKSSACVFLESATQMEKDNDGNDRFDWQNCIRMKLDAVDIGEILTVLQGIKPFAGSSDKGLYHANERGSTSLQFKTSDNGYYLRLASKVGNELKEIKHSVSFAEGTVLQSLLQCSIPFIYNWK